MSDSKAGPRDEERTRSSSPESGRLVLQTGDETLVVAVGASAGGLEPLKRLLGAVPRDANLAIVVIQHLSPTRESLLTSALQAASPLTVMEVHDGMPLAAGQVQVIPPNMTLALQDGRLRLHPRDDSERPPMPIDTFMRSLAAERKTEAIGVVLSGMGSDGTEGLKAIRAAGGRTYAQDPSTTAHDAMPRRAGAVGRGRAARARGQRRVPGDRPPLERGDRRGRLALQGDDAAAPDHAPDGARPRGGRRRVPAPPARGRGRAERAARRSLHPRDELLPRSRGLRGARGARLAGAAPGTGEGRP